MYYVTYLAGGEGGSQQMEMTLIAHSQSLLASLHFLSAEKNLLKSIKEYLLLCKCIS